MRISYRNTLLAATCIFAAGCGKPNRVLQPIFVDGRAAEPSGDSLVAMTRSGFPGLITRNNRTRLIDTIAYQVLRSPVQVQSTESGWLVSDTRDDGWWILTLDAAGNIVDSMAMTPYEASPNQFAGLPDGSIVVEAPGGILLRISETSVDTFAVTEENPTKTGLMVALSGGVLHAVPDMHITLYNGFGNPRWQLEWPWQETAVFSDIAVDSHGRPHMIAGIPRNGNFVVYSLDVVTGEVVRWSIPGPDATFVVEKMGQIRPDDAAAWAGG